MKVADTFFSTDFILQSLHGEGIKRKSTPAATTNATTTQLFDLLHLDEAPNHSVSPFEKEEEESGNPRNFNVVENEEDLNRVSGLSTMNSNHSNNLGVLANDDNNGLAEDEIDRAGHEDQRVPTVNNSDNDMYVVIGEDKEITLTTTNTTLIENPTNQDEDVTDTESRQQQQQPRRVSADQNDATTILDDSEVANDPGEPSSPSNNNSPDTTKSKKKKKKKRKRNRKSVSDELDVHQNDLANVDDEKEEEAILVDAGTLTSIEMSNDTITNGLSEASGDVVGNGDSQTTRM